jgi:hypothetical protein
MKNAKRKTLILTESVCEQHGNSTSEGSEIGSGFLSSCIKRYISTPLPSLALFYPPPPALLEIPVAIKLEVFSSKTIRQMFYS